MAIRCGFSAVAAAIEQIDENAWIDIAYSDGGVAQVAETTDTTGRHTLRLIVRRTRLVGRAQQRLWPDWRHHAFLTDLTGDVVEVDRFHRQHATIELAIRDIKEGAGLEHVPSGKFHASSAWLQCAVLAHNLTRWTAMLGEAASMTNSSSHAASAPTPRVTRPARQPLRPTNAAHAQPLAVGRPVRHRAQRDPRAHTRHRLTADSRTGAPPHRPCADNQRPRPLLQREPNPTTSPVNNTTPPSRRDQPPPPRLRRGRSRFSGDGPQFRDSVGRASSPGDLSPADGVRYGTGARFARGWVLVQQSSSPELVVAPHCRVLLA